LQKSPIKERYSAKETYNFKAPTHRSHPIVTSLRHVTSNKSLCHVTWHLSSHVSRRRVARRLSHITYIIRRSIASCRNKSQSHHMYHSITSRHIYHCATSHDIYHHTHHCVMQQEDLVTSHRSLRHVTHVSFPWHTYPYDPSRHYCGNACMCFCKQMHESRHTYDWVVSRWQALLWRPMYAFLCSGSCRIKTESRHICHTCVCVTSRIPLRHVTHVSVSCHIYSYHWHYCSNACMRFHQQTHNQKYVWVVIRPYHTHHTRHTHPYARRYCGNSWMRFRQLVRWWSRARVCASFRIESSCVMSFSAPSLPTCSSNDILHYIYVPHIIYTCRIILPGCS